ncbi:MAG: YceI family protein [Rhodoferax sp.]|uniref:YceI family protein n=1 Tax=Rhodoferax sp. TaxID=50421 RepID=UPI002ACD856A|nr:YceI family protein [Rhodoferax sp.]MDZ7892059.1 YceI family protein [Rhodoferax sp.]
MNPNTPPKLSRCGRAMSAPSLLRTTALPTALALFLGACSGGPDRIPPRTPLSPDATQARPPAAAPNATLATRYRVDPRESSLRILVYRGGTMARLGHNHVISSDDLQGQIWRGANAENSGFEIAVPVNTLIVDDNAARSEEGDDFPLNVTEDAKAGTKANMLRPTLLDGERYPEISISAASITGSTSNPAVVANMRIKDQTRAIQLPVTLSEAEGALAIQGSFEIRQTDFGITPLSIAMGALTVQDTVKIKFRLVAKAAPASP